MCKNDKNKKGDEDMIKSTTLNYPVTRKPKLQQALKEVEQIKSGKLARKSGRAFLNESRNQ